MRYNLIANIRNKQSSQEKSMSPYHTLIQHLRRRGYRITPQREMIIEAVAHRSGHTSAEEVYTQVHARTKSVNLATIYRTLDLLVEEGLASRSNLTDGQAVYAAKNHGPHIHLICRHCGTVWAAEHSLTECLAENLQRQYGFKADLSHLSLTGLCAACEEKLALSTEE
jgi:Fur family ferric uptake transcriptional regulator